MPGTATSKRATTEPEHANIVSRIKDVIQVGETCRNPDEQHWAGQLTEQQVQITIMYYVVRTKSLPQ